MREDAQEAFANLDPPAKAGNLEARHLRAQAERLIGASDWELSNNEEAKLHYDRGIADLTELLKRNIDPKISWRWMRSLADLYQSLGDVLLFRFNQREDARAAFDKVAGTARALGRARIQGTGAGTRSGMDHEQARRGRGTPGKYRSRAEIVYRGARPPRGAQGQDLGQPAMGQRISARSTANIGRLKRKQNRYAEAALVFARAEEILSAVNKRDPKNINRSATLNWIAFLARRKSLPLGVAKQRSHSPLVGAGANATVIATTTEIAREAGLRTQAQLNKVREEASLAAIDANASAIERQFRERGRWASSRRPTSSRTATCRMPPKMPWPDLLRENIEYLEWAGIAYIKAQKAAGSSGPLQARTRDARRISFNGGGDRFRGVSKAN